MSDTTETAYQDGHNIGQMMAKMRANGDGSYDCRYDLAGAARIGRDYFAEYKRGLEEGLAAGHEESHVGGDTR